MSEFTLNTSSVSYATAPTAYLDIRFDTEFEPQEPRQTRLIYAALAGVATGAVMMVGVTGGGLVLATATSDWSVSGEVAPVFGPIDERAVLSSRINAYRHLPENWDGIGGHAPPGKAVDEGLAFIDLLPLGTPSPTPFVAGDGEIGFEWKTAKGFVEVSFYGDGHIYYYANVYGKEVDGAEPYTGRSIPKDLAWALAAI